MARQTAMLTTQKVVENRFTVCQAEKAYEFHLSQRTLHPNP